ncbi:MAG TPA: hypothetical protein EYN91_15635 [Candidatus Melainabacteria bacterium]|jgi:hypothetical protein|nr:hypothetical protein [Candidatus Melainabacteria bacterium]HIN65184.1 hypothetical protein [Candidatus Obscuribacterales bacterium]
MTQSSVRGKYAPAREQQERSRKHLSEAGERHLPGGISKAVPEGTNIEMTTIVVIDSRLSRLSQRDFAVVFFDFGYIW